MIDPPSIIVVFESLETSPVTIVPSTRLCCSTEYKYGYLVALASFDAASGGTARFQALYVAGLLVVIHVVGAVGAVNDVVR